MKKGQISFTVGKGYFENSEPITNEQFLNLSVEDLLVQHHRRKSLNSCFYTQDIRETERLMFIISQDKEFISDFSMSKPNPENTIDIFQNTQQNSFVDVTLKELSKQLENSQGDYDIDFDKRSYSFRLIKGIKVKNMLEKIENYLENPNNIVLEKENNKPKI